MLLLVIVTSILYSVLNVGITFSRKGEERLAVIGVDRSFLDLLHRQVVGVWFDRSQNKLMLEVERDQLRMITSAPLIERGAGLVMAFYVYDESDQILYYGEKLDFYNQDYDEHYLPEVDEMVVLLRNVSEIDWQYDETEGVLTVTYLDRDYEISPRTWRLEE